VTVKVYVEGGGDSKALQTKCRQGFSEFFRTAGLARRMPRIVACGARSSAYRDFRTAHSRGGVDFPMLLVDSEGPMGHSDPWEHVRQRPGDQWTRPEGASEDHLHLMVQTMEAPR
jgi:hypothetical protein